MERECIFGGTYLDLSKTMKQVQCTGLLRSLKIHQLHQF